jgi:Spx/MgsR family transcriptional regulator
MKGLGVVVVLYGIGTCDTCKKARKALESEGVVVTFRDVRAEPLSEAEITEFVREFGDAIINRQSTTWRGASEFLRLSEPEDQLRSQPTLMKRPVIRSGAGLTLGWDERVMHRHLAG